MNILSPPIIVILLLGNYSIHAEVNTQSCTSGQGVSNQVCDADANITNGSTDLSAYCNQWAFSGECSSNPSFMIQNCAKSCEELDSSRNEGKSAFDLNEHCPQFAKLGECDVNPKYMREFCVKSCNEYDLKMQHTPLMKDKFTEKQRRLTKVRSDKCQLFMAESSIPNSGLGMYTAVDIKVGELAFYPEIVVSYFDNVMQYERHYFNNKAASDEWKKTSDNKVDKNPNCSAWAKSGECKANPNYMRTSCAKSCTLFDAGIMDGFDPYENWLPESYYWDTGNTDAMYEAESTDSLVPGIGALANSHTGLVNVQMGRPSIDSAGMHQSRDPGVGAFSTHYNMAWKATKDIPAGMEIFAEYGDNWFKGREDKFGPIPLSDDFDKADKITKKVNNIIGFKNDVLAQDVLSLMQELSNTQHLRMAFPDTVEKARKAVDEGTARVSVPDVIRSQEWLEQNGICLDNIRPDQSNIPQAGRGAFATRFISKGNIIAPMPLIHMDKDRLKMYKNINDGQSTIFDKDQLILNYCYGHEKSSLLLFPYSPITNYVNHNFDHSAINAKLQWSTSKYQKSHWFNKTTDEILAEPYAGLILEFVALRDIAEDEEIFIDYGREWGEAWKQHVDNWKPPAPRAADNNPPLHHLNHLNTLNTVEEQKLNPYSPHVMTICFVDKGVFNEESDSVEWSEFSIDPSSKYVSIDKSFKCDIMKRTMVNTETGFYEALVYDRDDEEEEEDEEDELERKSVLVLNIPRHAIEFTYRPYESDQHLKTAFRHPISIPTEIFPSKWMNLE